MNSRKCELCNVDVQSASYVQHLECREHLENIKQNEMIIPELSSQNLLKIKLMKYIILNP